MSQISRVIQRFSNSEKPQLVLIASFYGSAVRVDSDVEMQDSVYRVLKEVYPEVPEPKRVTVTHWEQDPYAIGS